MKSVGVWRQSFSDLRAWALADHVPWLGAAWLVLVVGILAAGNPALTSTAAQATYLLIALYALQWLVHDTGQPSLGHAAFLAVGAYATAGLRLRFGMDPALATLIAVIAAGACGWILGWGATRLRPAILALMTWAFGWTVFVAIGAFPEVTGGVAGLPLLGPLSVRIDLLGVLTRFDAAGHLVLGTVLLALVLVMYRSAQMSVIGRGWAALRDGTSLATSLGYDVPSIRRRTFALAAMTAGLAGSLGAQLLQLVDPTLYSPVRSLDLFVAVLVGAPLGFLGPVAGAAVISGLPYLVDRGFEAAGLPLGAGRELTAAALVVVALAASVTFQRRRRRQPGTAPAAAPRPRPAAPVSVRSGSALLEARGMELRFGAVAALAGATLTVRAGEVHGLVGPNGSGKSTLLRCIAGTLRQDTGNVTLSGTSVDHLGEAGRVAAGIARTFQRTAVMPHLDLVAHIEVGVRERRRHAHALQALLKTPAYRAESLAVRRAALDLVEMFGLGPFAGAAPDTLSSGRQRLLQMATAVATAPTVLLLDEPSAGMSPDEIELLHAALSELAGAGLTIVLIEHNMRFLASLASTVTVLDQGAVIAEGSPAEVARDSRVRAAYLGTVPVPG